MTYFTEIHHAIKTTPNKIALTCYDGNTLKSSITFQDLLHGLQHERKKLIQKKHNRGDLIPIIADSNPSIIIKMLACFSLELMAVPLKSALTQAQLNELMSEVDNIESNHETIILLLHSSGSTGSPKKIHYTQRYLNAFMTHHDYLYKQYSDEEGVGIYQSDLICPLPLYHFSGLALCLQGLMMGRSVHLLQSFQSKEYLQLAIDKKVRLLILLPSMLEFCVEYLLMNKKSCAIKYAITFGESTSCILLNKIRKGLGIKIFAPCGLTECQTGIGFSQELIEGVNHPVGSCGRQLFGQLKLIGKDGSSKDHRNEESYKGVLWVKNETTRACYLDNELNLKKYKKGWFNTGDIFRVDDSGYFFHCGRDDSMFVVNGQNIYPVEIENIFRKHPLIISCHSFPLVSVNGKVFPGVLLEVVMTGKQLSRNELIDFYLLCGEPHATPGWISFSTSLPRNSMGKLNRETCEQLLQSEYEQHYLKYAS